MAWDWILALLILFIGACLQGVVGFGLGLLCAPVLFIIKPELVPAPMILNALLITSLMSINNKSHIVGKQVSISLIGGAFGICAALFLLTRFDANFFNLLFGVLIIASVFFSISSVRPHLSVGAVLFASFFSGLIGTTTSAGGAPMGLLYRDQKEKRIKANLSAFFVFINTFGFIMLAWGGFAGWRDVYLFGACVPAVLAGWITSRYVCRWINQILIRKAILLMALMSGLFILVNAIYTL